MAQFDYTKYIGYTPTAQTTVKAPKFSLAAQGYKTPAYVNPRIPENNPYKSISNYQTRLSGVGVPAPERDADGDGGLLNGVLRVLQTTGSASTNVLHDIVKGVQTPGRQNTVGSLAKSYGKSWTGERQDTMTDVFDTMGWKADKNPDGRWYNPASWDMSNTARNLLTFAGDVAIDPLTYVSFGTVGLAKNATKGLTKEALGTLVTKQTSHITDITQDLAKELGEDPMAIAKRAMAASKGDAKSADLAMRTAYALASGGTASVDKRTMAYLVDKGLNGVNSDIIDAFAQKSLKAQEGITKSADGMSPMTKAVKSRSGTLSSFFGKSLSGDGGGLNIYDALKTAKSVDEFDAMVGGLTGVMKSFTLTNILAQPTLRPGRMAAYTAEEKAVKEIAAKRVYKNLDDATLATKMDAMDMTELDVLGALYDGFKGADISELEVMTHEIRKSLMKRKTLIKETDISKVMDKFEAERGLRSQVKELADGVEFANGLQRAYDQAGKRFYFRYHNPVTNQVKPLVELTGLVQNPAMKRAGEVALGLPVIKQSRDILGYIFQPEYMGKQARQIALRDADLKKLKDAYKTGNITKQDYDHAVAKANERYDNVIESRNDFAKKISKYLRIETSIPYKSVESAVNLFYDEAHVLDKAFLKSDKLRKAVTYYRQKGNSDVAKVGWELMTGKSLDDILDEMGRVTDDAFEEMDDELLEGMDTTIEELRKIFGDPKMQKFIKDHQVSAEDMAILERASGKVTAYFGALKDFDESRGTIFSNVEQSNHEAGVHGFGQDTPQTVGNVVTPENYVHAVYKNNRDADSFVVSSMDKSDVENIKTNSSGTAKSADEKRFPSMFDAMSAGKEPIDDIVMSMSLRHVESLRVDLNRRLVTDLEGAILTEPGFAQLISKNPMAGATPLKIGRTEFYAMPEVVNQLNRIVDTFSTNLGVAQLTSYMDNVTNWMKKFQTSFNPAFIMRNAIGEPAMNFFDGVKPESWEKAVQVLTGNKSEGFVKVGDTMFHKGEFAYRNSPDAPPEKSFLTPKQRASQDKDFAKGLDEFVANSTEPPRAGETPYKQRKRLERQYAKEHSAVPMQSHESIKAADPETGAIGYHAKTSKNEEDIREGIISGKGISTITLGNNTYTYVELMNHFRELGLGWSGVSKGNLIQNSAGTVKSEVRSQVGNPVVNTIGNLGDGVETLTRLSHFIDKLDQGFGLEEAAMGVRAYHVDYRDLTLPERNVFRRLAPYYTYMRKNLPIQVKNVYTNLGKVNMVSELVRASYDAIEVNNNGNAPVTDDFLKEGLAIPLGIDQQGNVQYLNWNLPIMDLGRLRLDFGESFDMNILEMLHPAIKAGFELPANTSLGFNQPIEKFQGEETPLLPNTDTFGIPKQANYFIQQMGVVESARKAIGAGYNAVTGAPADPMKPTQIPMLQSILPVKNQYNTLNNQAYQYRDQLQEYIKYLEQEGLPVPTLEELRRMSPSGYSGYTPR